MNEKETFTINDVDIMEKILRMFKDANLHPNIASGVLAASQAAIIFMLEDTYPEIADKEDELISDFARCVRLNLEQLKQNRTAESN